MLDLPQHWQAQLQTLFAHYAPAFEVWAYGSRVTGKAHEASDLDVVLIHPVDRERRCDTLGTLREALQASELPIMVDVMDWASVPPPFHQQMDRCRVLLFMPHAHHPTEQN